jgi:hypothetical protein
MEGRPIGRAALFGRLITEAFRSSEFRAAHGLARIAVDPVLQSAIWTRWQLSGLSGHSVPYYSSRWSLLAAIAERAPSSGRWMEFGVFRGDSINLLAEKCPSKIFGFDSFEGLPDDWTLVHHQGDYSTGGELPPVRENVVLIKGWFADSLPRFLDAEGTFPVAFLHIDSDLYSSADYVLSTLGDRLGPGSIIVFDEFAGVTPDDEFRAFRNFIRRSGKRFRYIGCSPGGQVAVEILGSGVG